MIKWKNRQGPGAPKHKHKAKTQADTQTASESQQPELKDLFEDYRERYRTLLLEDQTPLDPQPSSNDEKSNDDKQDQDVPLVYRAQIEHRAQLQRIVRSGHLDSEIFVQQWIGQTDQSQPRAMARVRAAPASYRESNPFHPTTRNLTIQISWRLLSNSGLIPDLICPVIGPGGWPWIPGSSIKGLFRRACSPDQSQKWCGVGDDATEIKPGCLRFHGAWPKDLSWRHGLLDLTHPQQAWQIGIENGGEIHNANAVISLLRPSLEVGISSQCKIEEEEWAQITKVLQQALSRGLGGRTAAGYGYGLISGQAPPLADDFLFSADLRGQGPASKLLDANPEFRPTMFRAAVRSMALRLFAGIVDQKIAQAEVERLFGGFLSGAKPINGLLACHFKHQIPVHHGWFGIGSDRQAVFTCEGRLSWHLTSQLTINEQGRVVLIRLLQHLLALVMSLAGIGRSWRRPDHRIFLPSYKIRPIGCHWEWSNPESQPSCLFPEDATQLASLIEAAGKCAVDWLALHCTLQPQQKQTIWHRLPVPWREVIHPSKMVVWCRKINSPEDAKAIAWIHRPRAEEHRKAALDLSGARWKGGFLSFNGKKKPVVSRLWIKMFPLLKPISRQTMNPSDICDEPLVHQGDVQLSPIWSGPYLEIVVLFPDYHPSQDQAEFIALMDAGGDSTPAFRRAWGSYRVPTQSR